MSSTPMFDPKSETTDANTATRAVEPAAGCPCGPGCTCSPCECESGCGCSKAPTAND